jgi:cytochrome c-type biogenesis protein CcmH/NrfG
MKRVGFCAASVLLAITCVDALAAEPAEVAELQTRGAPSSAIHERKLRLKPDDSAERLRTAEAYVLEAQDSPSKLDAASEHVDKVLEANPSNVGGLLLAGRIAMLRGQPAVAQTRYQAATMADPNNAAAFLGLGESWSRLGNDANASAAFTTYRKLSGLAPLPAPGSDVSPGPRQAPPKIIGPAKDPKTR